MSNQYAVQPNGLSTMTVEADSLVNNPNGSIELIKNDKVIMVVSIDNSKYVGLKDAYEIERRV